MGLKENLLIDLCTEYTKDEKASNNLSQVLVKWVIPSKSPSTGIIEVEAPWCETSSQYYLKPNMCYQVDTYISADTFGVRWEKGIAVKENGFEMLSPRNSVLNTQPAHAPCSGFPKGDTLMQMLEMFYDEIQDAVDRKVPLIIPTGTLEWLREAIK